MQFAKYHLPIKNSLAFYYLNCITHDLTDDYMSVTLTKEYKCCFFLNSICFIIAKKPRLHFAATAANKSSALLLRLVKSSFSNVKNIL